MNSTGIILSYWLKIKLYGRILSVACAPQGVIKTGGGRGGGNCGGGGGGGGDDICVI